MGMSASQARLLQVTSRLSDLELRAQNIANKKTRLSVESESVSTAYTDALNNKKLVLNTLDGSGQKKAIDLSANILTGFNQGLPSTEPQKLLKNSSGKVVVSSDVAAAFKKGSYDPEVFMNEFGYTKEPSKEGQFKLDPKATEYYLNLFKAIGDNGCVAEDSANLKSTAWLQEQLTNGNLTMAEFCRNSDGKNNPGFADISLSSKNSMAEVYDTSDDAPATAVYETKMSEINSKDKTFDLELKNVDTEHQAIQTEYDSIQKVIGKNAERTPKNFQG